MSLRLTREERELFDGIQGIPSRAELQAEITSLRSQLEEARAEIEVLNRRASVLQRLYDSEINFKIETFWDGGFDWWLGDALNRYQEKGNAKTYSDAVAALLSAAIHHYPDSTFVANIDRSLLNGPTEARTQKGETK
jgi:hypothetical protein